MMFDKLANLKYKYGNRHFWAEGTYAGTTGLNETAVRNRLRLKIKQDIAIDKLSVKDMKTLLRAASDTNAL